MSNPIPSQLALTSIPDGSQRVASPLRNNYAAIQTAFNELVAALSGGAAGQVLEAVDPTHVQWGSASPYLAHGKNTSPVSTSGTTFAAGADLLVAALSFTADGTSDYQVRVASPGWENSTASQFNFLHLNMDGADAGILCKSVTFSSVSAAFGLMVAGIIAAPAAGVHTVNIRFRVGGGTGTVDAGAAGAGVNMPILVTLEKIS